MVTKLLARCLLIVPLSSKSVILRNFSQKMRLHTLQAKLEFIARTLIQITEMVVFEDDF